MPLEETVKIGSAPLGALVGVALGVLIVVGAVVAFVRLRRGDVIENDFRGAGLLGGAVMRPIFGTRMGYAQPVLGLVIGGAIGGLGAWGYTSSASAIGADVAGHVRITYPFPRPSKRIPRDQISQVELRDAGSSRSTLVVRTSAGKRYESVSAPRASVVSAAALVQRTVGGGVPVLDCTSSGACAPTAEPALRTQRTASVRVRR